MLSSLTQIQLLIITAIFMALSLAGIAVAIWSSLKKNTVMSRRLSGVSKQDADFIPNSTAATPDMIASFGRHLTLPGPEEISKIRFKLSQAGFYEAKSIPMFYGASVVALLLPVFGLLAFWGIYGSQLPAEKLVLVAVTFIALGLFAPSIYLRGRIKKRQMQAREGFPDMMDLLLACIEAGLGLDAALSVVAKELGKRFPVIQINLDLLNLELMAGRTRPEAFKNFAERLGLEEAKSLNIMLKQSEEMGSSLGAALRTFSEEMRTKRMLRAEEKAMALPAKMTIPLIVFIFPTILLMMFLPAAARLTDAFV
ncbi:MAG: type II secretion system F family protein [Robiginitomaculum sp.]|nr:type II secretion system F family protein [Robiginitomaculum sp.]